MEVRETVLSEEQERKLLERVLQEEQEDDEVILWFSVCYLTLSM